MNNLSNNIIVILFYILNYEIRLQFFYKNWNCLISFASSGFYPTLKHFVKSYLIFLLFDNQKVLVMNTTVRNLKTKKGLGRRMNDMSLYIMRAYIKFITSI